MALRRKIKGWDILGKVEKEAIIKSFTFKDPKSFFSDAVRRGYSDGTVCLIEKTEGLIPFGLEHYLDDWKLEKLKFKRLKKYKTLGLKDRPYQEKALKTFFKVNFGIIKVSTGGGKTIIAREAMRAVLNVPDTNYKALFIVDQSDLLKQSVKRFEENLPFNVGVYSTGKLRDWKEKEIIVVTIQTLQAVLNKEIKRTRTSKGKKIRKTEEQYRKDLERSDKEKEFLKELLSNIDFAMVDEIQEFGSESRSRVLMENLTGLNWFMGLSATPYRKSDPIAKKRIMGFSGGIIYTVEEQLLVDEGFLAERRALFIYHSGEIEPFLVGVDVKDVRKNFGSDKRFFYENTEEINTEEINVFKLKEKVFDETGEELDLYAHIPNYGQFYRNFIVNNKTRNNIAKIVIEVLDELEMNSLCLVTKILQGETLSYLTGHPFVDGKSDGDERDMRLEQLQSEDKSVLIASNIFNKGVDIPAINVLFNCGAGKGQEITRQKKGRVLRKVKDDPRYDKALIVDFYDDFDRTFDEHSDERLKSYEEDIKNEDDIIFVEYTGNDRLFKKHLKAEFKDWFGK